MRLLHKGPSAAAKTVWGCRRTSSVVPVQELFVAADLRDWLPEGHLAWFVIDAVPQLD